MDSKSAVVADTLFEILSQPILVTRLVNTIYHSEHLIIALRHGSFNFGQVMGSHSEMISRENVGGL